MKKLTISGLSKTYSNGTTALKEVNLEVNQGMFGLLGPNGAGKSTLMRTIATLQSSDSGNIKFDSIDIQENQTKIKKKLGFLPQSFDFYPNLSAWDTLNYYAILKGITNHNERKNLVTEWLVKVNLYDQRKKRVGGFSGGMKQRLGIAQALIANPELVIVDEPTAGLDPKERNHFHNILSEIGEDKIVILSTHIVDDVSDLCTDMAIINQGQVILQGSPLAEVEKLTGRIWRKIIKKDELDWYSSEFEVISSHLYMGDIRVIVYSDSDLSGFELKTPDLEDVYFKTIPHQGDIVGGE
ncbi:ABC transporter ATP-binding protein [bacterium]|nr:ABC transporter ATP-binding protein [bacterium]